MDGNLISISIASLLLRRAFMTDVQVSVWNLVLNLNIHTISSSFLYVLNMAEAGNGTSQGSSLSILEMNLNLVVGHTT